MTATQAILFDAGNTLVYVDPERLAGVLADAGWPADSNTIRAAELSARRGLHAAIGQGHVGTEPEVWKAYFGTILVGAGVPPQALPAVGERLREAHAHGHLWTHVADGTEEALEALAALGCRLAVISNADGRIEGLLEEVGLRRHFEFVIDSEILGVEKPNAAIFHEGCRRLGLAPSRCLYVGDLYTVDYLGATDAGLRAVLLDPLELYGGRAPRVGALMELAALVTDGAPVAGDTSQV